MGKVHAKTNLILFASAVNLQIYYYLDMRVRLMGFYPSGYFIFREVASIADFSNELRKVQRGFSRGRVA